MDEHRQRANDVLLNTFSVSKQRYRVFYHSCVLVWEAENSRKDKASVPVSDIISVILSTTSSGKPRNPPQSNNIPTTYGTGEIPHPIGSVNADFDQITASISSESPTIATLSTQLDSTTKQNEIINNDTSPKDVLPIDKQKYLIINYAKRMSKHSNKWRAHQLILFNNEPRVVRLWYEQLQTDIKVQNRPKHLLLFLNPFGGKKDAFQLYEKFGKPLFQLAQIEVNLIVTQRAQQIHDILMSKKINLNNYDGVVCCGGDGTFSELFNGLVYRTMTDMGMDTNRPPYIPRPKLAIGVIPAGSTDTICYCMNGTTDIKTSIIHVILGQVSGLDISSVYKVNKNKITNEMEHTLLKLYASVISYGYLGDVAYDSERYRWMGPKRYDYSGVKKFLKNTGYNGQITVHIEKQNDPNDGVKCLDNCQRCYLARTGQSQSVNENDEELVIQGKFFMVNGANISCACKRSPNGFNPYSHIGDGYIDLVLVKHTSLFNNIRLLLTMTSKSRKIADLPFVEIYRTRKFTFKGPLSAIGKSIHRESSSGDSFTESNCGDNLGNLTNSTQPINNDDVDQRSNVSYKSKWNCDGEVLHDANILVRSNCQLIKVFRRGVPLSDSSCKSDDESVFCCGGNWCK